MEYQSLIQLMTSNKTLLTKKVMITPLFLVSVSLFSFVFSNSCSWPWWWHSFLYPFIKFYFSSLPMQVLSHALDKTWIFLICNGIVVVIANTSSINTVQYNSPSPPLDAKAVTYHHYSVLELSPEPGNAVFELLEEKEKESDTVVAAATVEEEEEGEGEGNREQEKIISCIIVEDDGELENEEEEEKEDQSETCFMMIEEEEEEEEEEDQVLVYDHDHEYQYEEGEEGGVGGGEGMDNLSTEELNKKFEDFIRKVKEELRIQLVQQQQLILSC